MRVGQMIFSAILSGGLLLGCGGEDEPTEIDGGADSGADGGSDSGADGGANPMVSGIVASGGELSMPVQGVTVAILGTELSATTDVAGAFSLSVPEGVQTIVTSKAGHWGFASREVVGEAGLSGLELNLLSDQDIESIEAALSRPTTLRGGVEPQYTFDETKGAIGVEFSGIEGEGGESVELSAAAGFSFTFGEESGPVDKGATEPPPCETGVPWVTSHLPEDVCDGDPDDVPNFLGFVNIAVGTTTVDAIGTAEATVNKIIEPIPRRTDCEVVGGDESEYPVIAKTITVVDATCTIEIPR